MAGARVAGGHRPGGRAHRAAGQRARLPAVGDAARRRSRGPHPAAEPRDVPEPEQSAGAGRYPDGAQRRAVRVGDEGRGAAGEPVPDGCRRRAGRRERSRISRHPGRGVLRLVQTRCTSPTTARCRRCTPTPIPCSSGASTPTATWWTGSGTPNLAAPVATHTGWNLRRAGFGEGGQCGGTGSFIPFAATEADREASGDPRPSFEARYPTHAAYVQAVSEAADALVGERLLLPGDAAAIVDLARGSGSTTQD